MSFFVTGTDTDAGKTYVSCALLRAARARGLRALGYKPIESGCPIAGKPGRDASALASAAGTDPESTYMLEPAIAPHLAAREAEVELDLTRVFEHAQSLRRNSEFFLVEGAGGFLVPISGSTSFSDIPRKLSLPSILVVADRLGAINHSLLTLEALASRDLPVACVVLTETESSSGRDLGNLRAIEEFSHAKAFSIPFVTKEEEATNHAGPILDYLLERFPQER